MPRAAMSGDEKFQSGLAETCSSRGRAGLRHVAVKTVGQVALRLEMIHEIVTMRLVLQK